MEMKDLTDKEIDTLDGLIVSSDLHSLNYGALRNFLERLHLSGFDLIRRVKG